MSKLLNLGLTDFIQKPEERLLQEYKEVLRRNGNDTLSPEALAVFNKMKKAVLGEEAESLQSARKQELSELIERAVREVGEELAGGAPVQKEADGLLGKIKGLLGR